MRTAMFVRDLVLEECEIHDFSSPTLAYYRYEDINRTTDGNLLIAEEVETVVVPVHQFNKRLKSGDIKETYIAYSEEVEKLLDMPFATLSRELREEREKTTRLHIDLSRCDSKLKNIVSLSLTDRIKFLFSEKYRDLLK